MSLEQLNNRPQGSGAATSHDPLSKSSRLLSQSALEPDADSEQVVTAVAIATPFERDPRNELVATTADLAAAVPLASFVPAVSPLAGTNADTLHANGRISSNAARSTVRSIIAFPFGLAARSLDLFSLLILISIVAAIPVVQFVSLGYLLIAAGRLAKGQPWRTCLPGLRLAGKLGQFGLLSGLLFVPVIVLQDLAQSAQILEPGSQPAVNWRLLAMFSAFVWLILVGWAAMRGGRWWHLIWPAPIRFLREIWRPSIWSKASDELYDLAIKLQLPRLWWLGAKATVGVLLWLVIPVSMMIIGLRSNAGIAPVLGIVGAILLSWALYYIPFLQMQFAKTGKLSSFLSVGQVRKNFAYAPWAHFVALLIFSAFAIPLYLLRIEDPPQELMWAPSLIFALLILPSKLLLGWAVGYAEKRRNQGLRIRQWYVRWPAHLLGLAPIAFYIGALYVAQLVVGIGAPVMYLQHAFLVPSPF